MFVQAHSNCWVWGCWVKLLTVPDTEDTFPLKTGEQPWCRWKEVKSFSRLVACSCEHAWPCAHYPWSSLFSLLPLLKQTIKRSATDSVKQLLSEVDPISPRNVTGEWDWCVVKSESSIWWQIRGEKTCQVDLKSQKMNAYQLSLEQNIQRPPLVFTEVYTAERN